jgi:two-component system response regulator MprA
MDRFTAQSTVPARRILVVDDDAASRAGFVGALRMAGYEVAEAWGAVQAMRVVLSYQPDAVVLDLVLPDGHGIEVGRAMRAIVTTSRTCVVAVTSSSASITFVDPASFGATEILLKPVSSETLLAAVGRCFSAPPPLALLALPLATPTAPTSEPPA